MKKMIMIVIGLVLALSLVGAGFATDTLVQKGQPQSVCSVLGGKINKNVYADYQGKRVYFCCPGCIDVFKKNPQSYLKKMEEQGITPDKTPVEH